MEMLNTNSFEIICMKPFFYWILIVWSSGLWSLLFSAASVQLFVIDEKLSDYGISVW